MIMNTSLLVAAITLSIIGVLTGTCAMILVIAQKMSTHKIEWRTFGEQEVQDAKELEKALRREEEDLFYDQM